MFTYPNILRVFILLHNNGKGKISVSFMSFHMKLSVVQCRNLESCSQFIMRHFVTVLCIAVHHPLSVITYVIL